MSDIVEDEVRCQMPLCRYKIIGEQVYAVNVECPGSCHLDDGWTTSE